MQSTNPSHEKDNYSGSAARPANLGHEARSRSQLLALAVISLLVTFSSATQGAISITNAVAHYSDRTITITGQGVKFPVLKQVIP